MTAPVGWSRVRVGDVTLAVGLVHVGQSTWVGLDISDGSQSSRRILLARREAEGLTYLIRGLADASEQGWAGPGLSAFDFTPAADGGGDAPRGPSAAAPLGHDVVVLTTPERPKLPVGVLVDGQWLECAGREGIRVDLPVDRPPMVHVALLANSIEFRVEDATVQTSDSPHRSAS